MKTPISGFEFSASEDHRLHPHSAEGEKSLSYPEQVKIFSQNYHMPLFEGLTLEKGVGSIYLKIDTWRDNFPP